MSAEEVGRTRWELESELASLEEDMRATPGEALPDALDLAERAVSVAMVEQHAPEAQQALAYARELVRLGEAGGEIPNDDALAALAQLRELIRTIAEADVATGPGSEDALADDLEG